MVLPYRHFILHLLAKGLTPMEIATECRRWDYAQPSVPEIRRIEESFGGIPDYVKPELSRTNTSMFRWLRDKGILPLWLDSQRLKDLNTFMRQTTIRQAAEILLICGIDGKREPLREVMDNLKTRFASGTIPSVETLHLYTSIFFRLDGMSYKDREGFVERAYVGEVQEAFEAAHNGDLTLVYAYLGMIHNFSETEMLNQIMRFNTQQLVLANKQGKLMSGQSQAGLATLQKVMLESNDRLTVFKERNAPQTDMAAKARLFGAKSPRVRALRQFDEVVKEEGEYIDVEADQEDGTGTAILARGSKP